jgi:polyisoprenoid-binding protein YceI
MRNRTEVARRLLVGALLSACGTHAASAQELHVDRGQPTVVRFISRTQLDEFEGVTERIDGYVVLDGQELGAANPSDTEIYFEVDLASIDTGIGLRNRHMRDNYLEVEKHPYASFAGRIAGAQMGAGASRVTAVGVFTVHGVSRQREIACQVTSRGRGYRADCAFVVELSDHAIEIPKVMFLELANAIEVRVEFTVSPAGDQQEGRP